VTEGPSGAAARVSPGSAAGAPPGAPAPVPPGPHGPRVDVAGYRVELAAPSDDPGIRALLREPMGGGIRISLEREPDARLAGGVEGERHLTMVARDRSGHMAAMGSRSVRTVWLDGAPARVGYLGQLRRRPEASRAAGPLLRAGFQVLGATRRPDELPFDLTSIASENVAARRLLERGVRGIPRYLPLAEVVTCLLPGGAGSPGRRGSSPGPRVRPLTGFPEVAHFLGRVLSRHPLAPVWTEEVLTSPTRSRGLSAGDFLVAEGAGGEILGCAALWDQRAFKQSRVQGYPPVLGVLRPLLNPFRTLAGLPGLPPPGAVLSMAFLSHLAVEGDDPETFLALVQSARLAARARGIHWLATGFVRGHPLLGVLEGAVPLRTYETVLYALPWDPGTSLPAFKGPGGEGPHLEVATL
jgi:hypothetical protein